jgi:hypothetical protein
MVLWQSVFNEVYSWRMELETRGSLSMDRHLEEQEGNVDTG